MAKLKLVLISDTHMKHWEIKLPKGDLLVVAGDFTFYGRVDELQDFNKWLGTIKHQFKHGVLLTGGNHDGLLEDNLPLAKQLLFNCRVLINEAIEVEGLKFFFSPISPFFHDWWFNVHKGLPIRAVWASIPDDTNVLITHSPPFGILDTVVGRRGEHLGCEELTARIGELKQLKLSVFGHIHSSSGQTTIGGVTYVNASQLDEQYQLAYKPIVIEL